MLNALYGNLDELYHSNGYDDLKAAQVTFGIYKKIAPSKIDVQ